MIGIYETYGEYELLADPRFLTASGHAVARHLAGLLLSGAVDLVSFFRFAPDSVPMQLLVDSLRIRDIRSRRVSHVITRVTMDLPGSWEEYLSGLSPNERQALRRKIRFYESEGVTLERISSPDAGAFADYVRLHMSSWEERKMKGYFSSGRFLEFLRRVNDGLMSAERARLYFLVKEGVRFAAVHTFTVNGACCFYLSGLDRRHPLVPKSPGKVLLAMVIREAIADRCTFFDFQGGDEDYKFQLGGHGTSFAKAVFWRSGISSWKANAFLTIQFLIIDLRWRWRDRALPLLRRTLRLRPPGRGKRA